jgi:cytochrome c oxidase cbb3-type subunit III
VFSYRSHPIRRLTITKLIVGTLFFAAGHSLAQEPANPVPADKAAVAAGRELFLTTCASCHGPDGKAQVQAMANAADLTHPEWFRRGSSDAAIFNSIRNGVGNAMPGHKDQISENDTWEIVDFIRSIEASAKSH